MDFANDSWPLGGSKMAELIRKQNWSATPLGNVHTWTPALKIAVGRVLDAHTASIVLWGKELTQIYNDAYALVLGLRHPTALGRNGWSRCAGIPIWFFNAPVYNRVMNTGKAVYLVDQEFKIELSGVMESHYFTLTYSPVRDETGMLCGVIVDLVETTADVKLARENLALEKASDAGKRRQAFRLALSDALRPCTTPDAIIAQASKLLGLELGVARVMYCEIEDTGTKFNVRHDWAHDGIASISGEIRSLSEFGAEVIEVMHAGRVLVISDIASDYKQAKVPPGYASVGVRAFIAIPLLQDGKLSVVLSVQRTEPYDWQPDELDLCQAVVESTWAAAENAKAQATLVAERDQSNAVFESMAEGFGLVDRNWTVLRMNKEGFGLVNRTADEVIGKNHWKIWPELIGTPVAKLYEEVKATGKPGSFEYLHEFFNGMKTWVEVRAYLTPDDGLAFFFRDVGARKFAEEKLKDADRRKDEFLAMLAHELRNPLAPISAAASLLMMGRHDEQRVKRASEIISRQVRHMSSLIDDLLDVSRVTRGQIELDKVAIDAKRIIADALEQIRPLIEAKHHQLTLAMSSESTFVLGDHKRLVQVVANLINNAAKYTANGGNITITTAISGGDVIISFVDDGIGMSKDLLDRAFDLFTQESRSSDRAQGGLGIGLALVKSLAELHGGSVSGESDGLGTGCRFVVRLPRISATEKVIKDVEAAPTATDRALRILVVDDNVDAGNMLAMVLTEFGHTVSTATDGKEALIQAANHSFDACLLDIGLPDMTGNQLAAQLRLQDRLKTAMLIAVTGYGQEQDELDSTAVGFDYHLVKPVDVERLANILNSAKAICS